MKSRVDILRAMACYKYGDPAPLNQLIDDLNDRVVELEATLARWPVRWLLKVLR